MTTGKDIAGVLDSKTAQKIYDDGLSTPVKESGKMLTDGVKALRLLGAPLQLAAGFQDRLEGWIDRVVRKIPEERLQPVPARLGGRLFGNYNILMMVITSQRCICIF